MDEKLKLKKSLSCWNSVWLADELGADVEASSIPVHQAVDV